MVNWIVTVTNEGAALIASIIASQGTLTITEARMSDEDYYGEEAALTEATFDGVFSTTTVSASIIDLTNIKMSADFNLSGLTEAHDIATVGFIANDGGSDVLLAVLTTEDTPDTAEPGININGGYVYFSVSLAVSSTQDITVVGTTAGVIYDTDVVDNLISTATNKPLAANQGRVLKGNIDDNFSGQSNENLIDNPFFTVNQRGFSSAIFQTGNVYTVDRWLIIGKTIGGSMSLSSSGMKLSRTGESTLGYLTQFLEDLTLGKPYTLSVLFADGTIESKTGIINSIADSISFSFANGLGSTRVYYLSGGSKWTVDVIVFAGSEFTIRAVKLEVGTVSTLANDVEPDQATELLKCQRYFYRLKALSSFAFFSSGIMDNATTYWGIINLPVPMRATPQITSAGSVYIRQGTNVLVSSITCGLRCPNILSVFAVTATSLTVGSAALLALDSTSSYIDFSADL